MALEDEIRDFSPPRQTPDGPPNYILFKLAGETFHALPEAPAGVLNDLIAGIDLDGAGNRVYRTPNLISFMVGVLREKEPLTPAEAAERGFEQPPGSDGYVWVRADDVSRFERIIYGKEHIVRIEELGDLVLHIGQKLSNRPTQLPVPNGSGQRTTTAI